MADGATLSKANSARPTLICFCHLRWNFVFQRPQQLLTRLATEYQVIVWEEPVYGNVAEPRVDLVESDGVRIATPKLPHGHSSDQAEAAQRSLLDALLGDDGTRLRRWRWPSRT